MRENRPYGLEGGESGKRTSLPLCREKLHAASSITLRQIRQSKVLGSHGRQCRSFADQRQVISVNDFAERNVAEGGGDLVGAAALDAADFVG